jgi:hypothetical protein
LDILYNFSAWLARFILENTLKTEKTAVPSESHDPTAPNGSSDQNDSNEQNEPIENDVQPTDYPMTDLGNADFPAFSLTEYSDESGIIRPRCQPCMPHYSPWLQQFFYSHGCLQGVFTDGL